MNKVELLSPAGSIDAFYAAINNGADAIYLGGKNFSARAFADNFSKENIAELVKYAHLRNVKIYITVNTLLDENEFNNAIKDIDFYYNNNVDALLIQDLGLYYYIKNKYPDFALHCSTQMHIHNISGVINAKKMGFSRVVIARESSLDFISQACKQGVEIETFVHGAICVSYSGQCLMSSSSKKRSANKGMCAQCCRLKYKLFDNEMPIKTNTDYLLSPKDMCLINDIPKLIEAGVSSFKIEGRMKSAAYVGYITSLYRKAIDSYYDNRSFVLSKEELDNMKVLFNRDFTNDYLYNKSSLFNQKTPNHLGILIGKTVGYKNNRIYIKLDKELNQFDGIRIDDFGQIVNKLYKDNLLVNKGKQGNIVSIESNNNVIGDVYKTQDYELEKLISHVPNKKIPLDINIVIKENEYVTLHSKQYNFSYTSNVKASKAINSPLSEKNIEQQFSKLNETPYFLSNISIDTYNAFLPIKIINEIRRDFIEKLNIYRLNSFNRTSIVSDITYNQLSDDSNYTDMYEKDGSIDTFPINYVINNESIYKESNGAVISEIGGLLINYEPKIAYYTLNCCNSYAYEFLKRIGFSKIILSSELNDTQIDNMIDSLYKRTGIIIKPYKFVKGDRALMYIKSNPLKKYTNSNELSLISDGNKYLAKYVNNITEIYEKHCINNNEHTFSFVKL